MMPVVDGIEITTEGLTKVFARVRAVTDLTVRVRPGRVTGFLGPNGAGKTTTLRMLLGLVAPTQGRALVGGVAYADLPDPTRTVGASLEATSFHPGRSGRNHLRVVALAAGLPEGRVDECLELTGLSGAAHQRVGGYSLGMRQRLGLATTMLGDPPVLILDEPANGLDPQGIAWLRGFLRHLAASGRTVLVSSHVLAEVEQTVVDVVIIADGRLVRAAPLAELRRGAATIVRTPTPERLADALAGAGLPRPTPAGTPGAWRVPEVLPERVGHAAYAAGVEVHELYTETDDLEAVFLSLVTGASPPAPLVPTDPAPVQP